MTRTLTELMALRRAGLLQPDTEQDWTDDESAAIKAAYRANRSPELHQLFPAECEEVDNENSAAYYLVQSNEGLRRWLADDAEHAAEQHRDAFPDEPIISITVT